MRMLVATTRLLTLLAVFGLGLTGGADAHGSQPSHTHVTEAHHASPHEHSRMKVECCDTGASEIVHCGANLLAVASNIDLFLPRSTSVGLTGKNHLRHGINHAVDPPPPRFVLA